MHTSLTASSKEQWVDVIQRERPRLVLLARQWVPSLGDAEDVVQEALARFCNRNNGTVVDPPAYLYVCVKHAAFDFVRASKRLPCVENVDGVQAPLFECPLEREERRAALEAALQQLPTEQRVVLVLKVWGELTYPRIAEVIGIPANTAASRFRYALAALRNLMDQEEVT
jgi:RNA polymerase sigma-70 factor (ECF subfamily)